MAENLSGVRRTTSLTVRAAGVDVPMMTAVTKAEVPWASVMARHLLADPASHEYRRTLRCLLLAEEPPWQWRMWRDTQPRVDVQGATLVLTDEVHTAVDALGFAEPSDGPQDVRFGPWVLSAGAGGTLHLRLPTEATPPGVPWKQVTITYPSRWLRSPSPTPASVTATGATWSDERGGIVFDLAPGPHAKGAAAMNLWPRRVVLEVSWELWDVVMLLIPLLLFLRLPHAEHRPRAGLLLVTAAAFTVLAPLRVVLYQLTGPAVTSGTAEFVYWAAEAALVPVVVPALLWAGGLARPVVSGASAALVFPVTGVTAWALDRSPPDERFPEGLPVLPVWPFLAVAAVVLTALVVAAFLNGCRLAWTSQARGRVPSWIWAVSAAVGVVTAAYACYGSHRDRQGAGLLADVGDLEPAAGLTYDLLWLPPVLLTWVGGGLLWIWPVAVLGAVLRRRAEDAPAGGVPLLHPPAAPGRVAVNRAIVAWLVLATMLSWSQYYGWLWLPVSLVAGAAALWPALRLSQRWVLALRRLDGAGTPLLYGQVAPVHLPLLRDRARRFLVTQRTGRQRDAAMLTPDGDLKTWTKDTEEAQTELARLRAWPPRKDPVENGPVENGPTGNDPTKNGPAGAGPTGDGDGPTGNGPAGNGPAGNGPAGNGPAREGPAREGPAGDGPAGKSGLALPEDVSPLDVALLAGPDPSPAALAARTGALTAALGVLPGAYLLWHTYVAEGHWGRLDWLAGFYEPAFALWELLYWYVPGYLLGLLWRELPGRTGPVRALPVAGAVAVSALAQTLLAWILDLAPLGDLLLRTVLLTAVLTTAGLVLDLRTMRAVLPPWSRVWRFLVGVYRLESLPSQATFLLAQAAAVVAVIQFVRGEGGELPSSGSGGPPVPAVKP
ncbi:DUF6185 family protein [Sphaerisporangium sp. B11E5]|uniref:DUF6185 family protein n=1 Tax=Sphaerisporangium sp. B11E5 TaxID=3153563 RepID=UPI00325DA085